MPNKAKPADPAYNPNLPPIDNPDQPQFTDQVLLQDIYATMDLTRFALNPTEPIPLPKYIESEPIRENFGETTYLNLNEIGVYGYLRSYQYNSYFEYNLVKDHPYLHLFPGLKYAIREREEVARKYPDVSQVQMMPFFNCQHYPELGYNQVELTRFYGIEQLIYNPWFEIISM